MSSAGTDRTPVGPRLTQYSPAGGCGCKLSQQALGAVLGAVGGGPKTFPGLRVGLTPPDDAAVLDLGGLADRSLVFTCDFQTPVVDDPQTWGRIAAVNAMSDVYAMGGRPLLALNIVAWPADLDATYLRQVLDGGRRAVEADGAVVVGGHTIDDPAPKYGLAVIGQVAPDAVLTKGGGLDGDRLVLTKPLGVGTVGTAIKRGRATPDQVRAAADVMSRSNAAASRVAVDAGLRCATDVTGFGLLGHLHEVAAASGLAAELWLDRVPRLDSVSGLIAAGCAPDGGRRTLTQALETGWLHPGRSTTEERLLLADPQTSGGLLLAVPPAQVPDLLTRLRRAGDLAAAEVGLLRSGGAGAIMVGDAPDGGP